MKLWNGCDRLLRAADKLEGNCWALLGHGASVTADLKPTHLALAEATGGKPTALFGPEHGYYGVEQDMVASVDQADPWTGAPILSLYGDSEDSLRPSPSAFVGLDVLLIDVQDVGARYYTYAATAVWAAEAAIEAGAEVWVLDRPNPLGGTRVEGNLRGDGFDSFVGAFVTPVVHGMTIGELVRLEAKRRGWPPDALQVWTIAGWRRTMTWRDTGLPWIAPSPNMPTVDTAVIYPGGCLIEATTLSEGRGTTRPFQLVGAPGIDPPRLATTLEQRRLLGVRFLPTYFKPQFQKHAGEVCGGVEIVVDDPATFQAYRCGIELLRAIHGLFPDSFGWRDEPYEFVSDRPAIDLLTGSSHLREILDGSSGSGADVGAEEERFADWLRSWRDDETSFRTERSAVLLYE